MAVRPIVRAPDKRLLQVSESFDRGNPDHQAIALDLGETILSRTDALGLAAVQIGHLVRVIGAKVGDGVLVMCNPEVIEASSVTVIEPESCLSYPYLGPVKVERPQQAVIRWTSPTGEASQERLYGSRLRIVLHEIDHLNGITMDTIRRRNRQ